MTKSLTFSIFYRAKLGDAKTNQQEAMVDEQRNDQQQFFERFTAW